MQREKLVIIGNGMAPGRALEKLFEAAPGQLRRHRSSTPSRA
jgi:NAD(P)H-nitrite reductase large subunit